MASAHNATNLSDALAALNKGVKKITFADCDPKLGDNGVAELARTLRQKKDVFWLGMFDQEMSSYGLDQLVGALKGNKDLKHLDIGRNDVGDEGIELLCNFLATNKSVTEVYLWETNMTDVGAKKIEEMLLKNRHIERLDLNDNPQVSQEMKQRISALLKMGETRVPASPRMEAMKFPTQAAALKI